MAAPGGLNERSRYLRSLHEAGGGAGSVGLLRPDEVAEEKGDHEDHQEHLGEQEQDDADPESDADFLFEVHAGATLSRSGDGEDSTVADGGRQSNRPIGKRIARGTETESKIMRCL